MFDDIPAARANQVLVRFLNLYPDKPEAWELAMLVVLQRFDHATAASAKKATAGLSLALDRAPGNTRGTAPWPAKRSATRRTSEK